MENVYERMKAIQLLAFYLYAESKITDEQFELLITNSLGTINEIGGSDLVSRSKTEIDSIIGGNDNV